MTEFARIVEAYKSMANEARYRPAAPGDGCGSVYLTKEECKDRELLQREAEKYAKQFIETEDKDFGKFRIGVSNYETNRALVYVIEAARSLCGGVDDLAVDLLEMAMAEVRAESRKFRKKTA
jgi:hypothetical protein